MPQKTSIEWTQLTSNPIRARRKDNGHEGHHCVKVSPGCAHCYSEVLDNRFGTQLPYNQAGHEQVELFVKEAELIGLLKLKKPHKIFLGDMTDIFQDGVTDAMLDQVFATMAICREQTFQVLTKRVGRMALYLKDPGTPKRIARAIEKLGPKLPVTWRAWGWSIAMGLSLGKTWPLPNLHVGCSVENQAEADRRIPLLLRLPAAVRFLSVEPLLGPVDLRRGVYLMPPSPGGESGTTLDGVDWVIVGGESGHGARPMDPDWVRSLRDQCVAAGVPFFFKQWGGRKKKESGRELDGRTWDQFPREREVVSV